MVQVMDLTGKIVNPSLMPKISDEAYKLMCLSRKQDEFQNKIHALAFGTQVRGFKPGRNRRIFQGENILSAPSFGREVKPWVPCR
jgi:hypothetical protein